MIAAVPSIISSQERRIKEEDVQKLKMLGLSREKIDSFKQKDELTKRSKLVSKSAYDTWLSQYMKQGGKPTHFYNYAFPVHEFVVAENDCDTGDRYGANSFNVISLNGSDIKVGGHCHSYVITKDGKAVYNGHFWIPIYTDFMYKGEKTTEAKQISPINEKLINEIICSENMNTEDVSNLIDITYENYLAAVFTNYNSFSNEIIQTTKALEDVYEEYLNILLKGLRVKHGNILFYADKKLVEQFKENRKSMHEYNEEYFIIRLDNETKKKIICDLSLKKGITNLYNNNENTYPDSSKPENKDNIKIDKLTVKDRVKHVLNMFLKKND